MKQSKNKPVKLDILVGSGCMSAIEGDGYFCKKTYHELCINTNKSEALDGIKKSWVCPICVSKKPKGGNNCDTPVRSICSLDPDHDDTQCITVRRKVSTHESCSDETQLPTKNDARNIIRETLNEMLPTITDKIKAEFRLAVKEELKAMRDTIGAIESSIEFLNAEHEDLKESHNEHIKKVKELETENNALLSALERLNHKINTTDQLNRSSNVEIQCVPEHRNENLITKTLQIAKVISCEVKEGDFFHCTRIAKRNNSDDRPRSIIVRLATPRLRDTFLAKAILYNKAYPNERLNSNLIDVKGEKKAIYIGKHLSQENKTLHAAARLKAKKLSYKFVWVKQGRIFMRKSETSNYVYVRDKKTLDNLT